MGQAHAVDAASHSRLKLRACREMAPGAEWEIGVVFARKAEVALEGDGKLG